MAELEYRNLRKVFSDGTVAVEGLSLKASDGEFIVLVGPSGCGKTTTLMMTAGLETVTQGDVVIGGSVVNDAHPKDRDIAMVFQSYALYPHMNVRDNIAFGLRRRRMPRSEIDQRVSDAARTLDLEAYLKRKPAQLSGGQRQRVAMGRAIVRRPQLFLMDEPLSNLDAKLRVQMRAQIKQLQRELEATTLYVTHDQTEAMTMGDRVVVMRKGVIEQVGTPRELYHNPSNLFVAEFIGSPAMNLVKVDVEVGHNGVVVRVGSNGANLTIDDDRLRNQLRTFHGRSLALGFRPENVSLAAEYSANSIPAVIRHVEDLGAEQIIHFAVEAQPVVTEETQQAAVDLGEVVASDPIRQSREEAICIGRLAGDVVVAIGERVQLRLNSDQLHFFDLTTGAAASAKNESDARILA